MGFDFASLKAKARRQVHNTFGVPALYAGPEPNPVPVALSVRYHTKMSTSTSGDGDTIYLEGITRIVFDQDEIAQKSVVLKRNGRVTLLPYNLTFALADLVPIDGPVDLIWNVVTESRPVTM